MKSFITTALASLFKKRSKSKKKSRKTLQMWTLVILSMLVAFWFDMDPTILKELLSLLTVFLH
ncbi:hypothetical protein [Gynuella sunshinyii]|uniref:Uncharacterized protein n=1 Tax=Gynuella sunshinyii YC6258 TaxID=1445510 RepID=A0A0C5V469_9GAMM|nr:hypothetical protein [Gynuella sunshinyii]AJQ94245.1 hypothetical Protein YC6258_02207 [Gynuella sunshinyii YC6258]